MAPKVLATTRRLDPTTNDCNAVAPEHDRTYGKASTLVTLARIIRDCFLDQTGSLRIFHRTRRDFRVGVTNILFHKAISKPIFLTATMRMMHSPHQQTNVWYDNQQEGFASALHSDDDGFLGLNVEDCIKRSWRNSMIRRAVAHHDPNLYFDMLFYMNLWRCRVDGDEEDIVSGEIPKRFQDMRIKKY